MTNRDPAPRVLHHGRLIDLTLETAVLPDGRRIELEIVSHPGGAVAVAVDAAGRVCLLEQYRYAAGGTIWELPAGTIDSGESPSETARRELREEAGVIAADWTDLGAIYSTPGFCNERLYLYLARELQSVNPDHGHDEVIEVHWLPFSDAFAMAREGAISDAKTVAALFRAASYVDSRGD